MTDRHPRAMSPRRPAHLRRAPSVARLLLLVALVALPAGAARAHAIDGDAVAAGLLDALIATALLLPALLYLRGRRRGPLRWRDGAQAAGLLLLVVALFGPLETLASQSFAAHMAQHMVLVALAPPLLALARPGPAMLRGLPARLRGVARWPRQRLLRPLTDLSRSVRATAVLHGLTIWLWHVPAAFELALRNDLLHAAEHLTLLASGLLFWRAVRRARGSAQGTALMWLLLTLMHTGLLGALLALSPHPLYPSYALRPDVLADQQLAGLIMWVPMGLVYLAAGQWVALRLLRPHGAAKPLRA